MSAHPMMTSPPTSAAFLAAWKNSIALSGFHFFGDGTPTGNPPTAVQVTSMANNTFGVRWTRASGDVGTNTIVATPASGGACLGLPDRPASGRNIPQAAWRRCSSDRRRQTDRSRPNRRADGTPGSRASKTAARPLPPKAGAFSYYFFLRHNSLRPLRPYVQPAGILPLGGV